MSGTNLKLVTAQNLTTVYDTTVTIVSSSLAATATLTFDTAFGLTPSVLGIYIADGTKNRGYNRCQPESVGLSDLGIYLKADASVSDGTLNVRTIVTGQHS